MYTLKLTATIPFKHLCCPLVAPCEDVSGTCLTIENGRNLGGWVNDQRAKYKIGDLSPEQISKLEAMKGWDWAPSANLKPK